ncbi:hypothetical protein AB0K52_04885 [Glycomyces sp. NPDC049804]|uniref:hypothetical protein n=1 Tax=Glycomyces sp. NPDC049804 TaxID=3154363 RepID=UPI00343361AD
MGNPDQLLVVLSDERSNLRTGYAVACPFAETGAVGGSEAGSLFHSLSPSPGFIAWPVAISVLTSSCVDLRGEVEAGTLAAARAATAARFTD